MFTTVESLKYILENAHGILLFFCLVHLDAPSGKVKRIRMYCEGCVAVESTVHGEEFAKTCFCI